MRSRIVITLLYIAAYAFLILLITGICYLELRLLPNLPV